MSWFSWKKYTVDTNWTGDRWGIHLYRKEYTVLSSFPFETTIKSDYVKTETERDAIINDFIVNKDKYIREYENKEQQGRSIKLP